MTRSQCLTQLFLLDWKLKQKHTDVYIWIKGEDKVWIPRVDYSYGVKMTITRQRADPLDPKNTVLTSFTAYEALFAALENNDDE